MKALFIGNSQMQLYDLPGMMEEMSRSAPPDYPRLEIGRSLSGGRGLKLHWEAGEGPGTPRALIAAGPWDYVVMQEILNADAGVFEEYAELFDELIRKNGSQTLLFATASASQYYGIGDVPLATVKADPEFKPLYKYPDSFKSLNDMQVAFGKKRGIPVAAAGYAWMNYLGSDPLDEQLLDLYYKDRGHPGSKGTYIYACLLYAYLTGRNPTGLVSEFKDIQDGISISREEAAKIQKTAWNQYLENNKPTRKNKSTTSGQAPGHLRI